MGVIKFIMQEYNIESIDDLVICEDPAIYHINIDGLVVSIYFKLNKSSEKLYVFSPGYLNRNEYSHPYFQRLKWFESIDASGIILTDPTLGIHKDIGIGWFQGDEKSYAPVKIAKLIDVFLKKLNVERKKTLFFGSSAGGFASLVLATILKGSCCVVNNPQTNVLNFREPFVGDMLERCYQGFTRDKVEKIFLNRLSAADLMISSNHVPKCLYIQNISDAEHYTRHLVPFIEKLGAYFSQADQPFFDNMIVKLYKNDKAGHNPATYDFIKKYFSLAEKEFF